MMIINDNNGYDGVNENCGIINDIMDMLEFNDTLLLKIKMLFYLLIQLEESSIIT